jgi:hypothetical protein
MGGSLWKGKKTITLMNETQHCQPSPNPSQLEGCHAPDRKQRSFHLTYKNVFLIKKKKTVKRACKSA